MIGLIGKKVGMTTIFNEDGQAFPVTIIEAGPCEIVQVKTAARDGYSAIQLGFDSTDKKVTKPLLGHFQKAGTKVYKKLKEFRIEDDGSYEVGQTLTVEQFSAGDKISVSGVSKGKGFQGACRRYGFAGGPKTHGQSNKFRSPGSLGASSYPSRVHKGKHMAGRMGDKRITQHGNKVIKVDAENNLILIKGAIAGPRGGYIIIKKR